MFHRILCATDFSPRSDRAVEHAAAWAARTDASLELFHVLEPTLFTAPELAPLYVQIEEVGLRELQARMDARVEALRARVPKITGHVRLGLPAVQILARISDTKPDLVVLGTAGHGYVARAILGSVADRVIRSCQTPLLIVPSEGRDYRSIPARIVAPTDFSPPARSAVRRAETLAEALGAALTVVHAYEIPPFVERHADLARSLRAAMSVQIHAEHPELVEHASTSARALEGAPARTIVAITEDLQADLIVMASTGRGLLSSLLLGGVTDRVLRTARVPVLMLRDAAS